MSLDPLLVNSLLIGAAVRRYFCTFAAEYRSVSLRYGEGYATHHCQQRETSGNDEGEKHAFGVITDWISAEQFAMLIVVFTHFITRR